MDEKAKFKVEEKQRSFLARRTVININGKVITTPCYGAILKKPADLNGVFSAFSHIGQTKVFFAAAKLLATINDTADSEKKTQVLNKFVSLKQDNLFFVDPTTTNFLLKEKSIDDLTPEYWTGAHSEPKVLMSFIKSAVERQHQLSDAIIPPSPLIKADSPKYLTKLWFDVVKTTGTYASASYGKSSSILINLHFSAFRNTNKLNEITEILNREDNEREIADIKAVFLRVKDPRFEADVGAITRYKNFVQDLALYAKRTERAFFVYNADSIGLASIPLGADGFIEPQDGQLSEGGGRSLKKHGSLYDSMGLKHTRFEDVEEVFQNNGKIMSHDCEYCVKYNGIDSLKKAPLAEWWIDKRSHLLVCRNHELNEVIVGIQDNSVSQSIREKFQRSSVKNYLDALP